MIVAVVWSLFGTGLLALGGIRLPGLEFFNQRVEAAYRKELVLGEDDPARADPPTLSELFPGAVSATWFGMVAPPKKPDGPPVCPRCTPNSLPQNLPGD